MKWRNVSSFQRTMRKGDYDSLTEAWWVDLCRARELMPLHVRERSGQTVKSDSAGKLFSVTDNSTLLTKLRSEENLVAII